MTESRAAMFDFARLDDVAFAAERGRLNGRNLPCHAARDLGPVIELVQLASNGTLPGPSQIGWLEPAGLDHFLRALAGHSESWVRPGTRDMGFLKTFASAPKDESAWTAFGLAAQQAATAAGFPKRIAAQLTAALGELHSNIYEHSDAPGTGLAAFRAEPDRFEFVVTDRGIGVLDSLRRCPDYQHLADHGEALRLALTDGVSRYGASSGRGRGFRPLFIGLANLNGALRFRAGDHALLIDGQTPSLMTARPAQKPALPGFFVSVVCEAASRSPH